MLLYKSLHCSKPYSTSTESRTKPQSSQNWRIQIKQSQLVFQISSILLQRKNWVIPLQNLNLSSKLTPFIFLQILLKIKQDPQISLRFFNWVRTSLGFKPDLKSHCRIIQIAVASGCSNHVGHILDSMVQTHPATLVADSMICTCKGNDSQLNPLSLVIQCYADKGLALEGLEVFRRMRFHKYKPSIHSCNSLLDALYRENQIKLALCLYSAMVRDEVSIDTSTWSLLALILSKNGKMEGVVRLVDIGIYSSVIYDLVIEYYSRNGDFSSAFSRLNEMFDREELHPDFTTCSLILDEACKSNNTEMMNRITTIMVEKKLYPEYPFQETDSLIQKLCDSGRTHAAEMVFKTASDKKNIEMKDSTYGRMLTSLSKVGRIKEAIEIHHMICRNGLSVNDDSYVAFANALCAHDRSGYELLRDVIRRGFVPTGSELSKFIESQCRKGRWREADELLTTVLEMGLLPDSLFCCRLLVGYYCSRRRLDKAMVLHNEMEKRKGGLDVKTYNVLIHGLFKNGRVDEALRVFDYMDGLSLCSGESFAIMIRGLCRVKEMRKAMRFHDEMLKKGLKPDEATYKRVISGFKL